MKIKIRENSPELITEPDKIIARLLQLRGIDKKAVSEFLKPRNPLDTTLIDMGIDRAQFEFAYKRIVQALQQKEKVVLWSDYDVDGVTAGTIMWQTLHSIGLDIHPHIPYRKSGEGYGFSEKGIERMLGNNGAPSLVITVDHGISGGDFIKILKKKNIDVIVLDHHEKMKGDPKSAKAVLYTKQVCAAGVSYFVAYALIERLFKDKLIKKNVYDSLKQCFNNDYLVLAGIGTVADIMKLQGVSRSLAYYALKKMAGIENIGLHELFKVAGIENETNYTTYHIGFIIGPRLNAAGRMGDALDAMRLLCTNNRTRALELSTLLNNHNKDRQKELKEHIVEAEKLLKGQENNPVLFIHSDLFQEGTVGLIAAKLTQNHHRPAFVAAVSNGKLKGSIRSIRGVSIVPMLALCADVLTAYGGHERAGGFALNFKDVSLFREKLLAAAHSLIEPHHLERLLEVDMHIPLSAATLFLVRKIFELEPFGEGNEEPLFVSEANVVSFRTVGKTGEHVQLFVRGFDPSTLSIKGIFFNGKKVCENLDISRKVQLVYALGIDTYGKEKVNLMVKHIEQ